jgi:oligopeptide/dipeptide ABC transporter ATP-binding protein
MEPLLSVKDLVVEFSTEKGIARAVDGVSFDLQKGETLGLVGESGCGKSVTSLAIMQLIPVPPGKIVSGSILFQGDDLLQKNERQMRSIRGRDISMIFQEPMTALNPVFTVGSQLGDIIRRHRNLSSKKARQLAIKILDQVNIPSPEKRIDQYPHQLSGGMRQRVMIAMAISCNPSLLLADEPTTALDVTVQAQVMETIKQLQESDDMGMMLITHDMGVIAETCQRVVVMYCGAVVEKADVKTLFSSAKHPYTNGLMHSIPKIREEKLEKLPTIAGTVPDLLQLPAGCRFVDRCSDAQERCRCEQPTLQSQPDGSEVACFYPLTGKGLTGNSAL